MRIELENVNELKVLENPPSLIISAETTVAIKLTKDIHAHPEYHHGTNSRTTIALSGERREVFVDAPISPERADDICKQINRLLGWEQ